ncbi:uncharacterized protein LOC131437504 isoform X1 [Malaya genurostris]|uniref:uncharacterized protein LOC131437504 isoform X1 n=1 Tax=Malaya genurostris TaxID=325434 RepID=UPI0026F3CFAD|nr:uncharacterized protein LOC131437504 isoform X1 [Malaya genurostris]
MLFFIRSVFAAVVLFAIVVMVVESTPTPEKTKNMENKNICGKLLRTPANDLELYLQSEYPEKHDTFCFVRCLAILSATYDDETGVNLAKLYESLGKGMTEQEFTEQASTCLAEKEGEPEETCYCRKAWKPISCIHKQYHDRKNSATA